MADLSQTSGRVVPGAGATFGSGTAGSGGITAGEPVYVDSSNLVQPAKGDTAVHANCRGIAVNSASSGQPVTYQTSGNINIGATLVAGTVYVVAADNAGAIAPNADMTSGNFPTLLGYATTTSNLLMLLTPTGVAHG